MKKFMFIICFLLYQFQTFGQASSVFFEIGGQGLGASLNYDLRLNPFNANSIGLRIGAGGFKGQDTFFSIPIGINKLIGSGQSYFDLGLGATYLNNQGSKINCATGYYDSKGDYICSDPIIDYGIYSLPIDKKSSVVGTLNFGYRKIPKYGGFTWRISLTPLFNFEKFNPFFGGIGIGYIL
jgi:hypothetical protein